MKSIIVIAMLCNQPMSAILMHPDTEATYTINAPIKKYIPLAIKDQISKGREVRITKINTTLNMKGCS
jgi:hypothetical protein